MANKLLNIRMDENMIKDLKEVCGELGVNVTDAIKAFSKNMIENRELPAVKEEKENFTLETLSKEYAEYQETNKNIKEYEEMNEKISNIILACNENLRNFIFYHWTDNSYQELVSKFKEEYGEKFKDEILDIITNFYEFYYHDTAESYLPIYEEIKKFENEKYISAMENIKEKNPQLYKELLDNYTYNLKFDKMYVFNSSGYFETKKAIEELLSPEEIKEYVEYMNKIDSYKTEEEKSNYRNSIPDETKIILASAFAKINEYQEENRKKEKIEESEIEESETEENLTKI